MSLETKIVTALTSLVGGRVYASTFPQQPATPITPAILFTFVSSEINADICGDGGDATANTRIQVDVYSATFDSARALRLQVLTAMALITPPTLWEGGFGSYEPDLKLHRCSMDFIHYPSST